MSYTLTVGSERWHRAGAATMSLLLVKDECISATAWERLSQELSLQAPLRTCWLTPSLCYWWLMGNLFPLKSLPHVTPLLETSLSNYMAPGAQARTLARPFGKVANSVLARFSQSFLTGVSGEMSTGVGLFSAQLREDMPGHVLTGIKQGSC